MKICLRFSLLKVKRNSFSFPHIYGYVILGHRKVYPQSSPSKKLRKKYDVRGVNIYVCDGGIHLCHWRDVRRILWRLDCQQIRTKGWSLDQQHCRNNSSYCHGFLEICYFLRTSDSWQISYWCQLW